MSLSARLRLDRGAFCLDVALDVADGEVVAVLGPNGAGKTTLLRLLAGLDPLTAGTVDLGRVRLEDAARHHRVAARDRHVGMVFQDHRLFPHLSARDNVAFGPRSTGTSRAAARTVADRWLVRLGVGELCERRPDQLSGGQAQRVALARALAAGPDLLLFDEPLAALDAGTREETRRELGRQLATFPGPVLLVTHDLLDALVLADRVVVLESGRVVQDDPPTLLTRRPRTAYAAGLVGLNLYGGTAADGRLTVDAAYGGGSLPVADRGLTGPALAVVDPAAVRLRPPVTDPPHVTDLPHVMGPPDVTDPPDGAVCWTGCVRSVADLGGRVRVELDGPPAVRADLDTRTAAALGLDAGRLLTVTVRTADVDAYPAA